MIHKCKKSDILHLMEKEPSKRGRPKMADTRKIVSLPADLAQAVEDYRFGNRFRSEAEALRRLIELGLAQSGNQPGKPPEEPKTTKRRSRKS